MVYDERERLAAARAEVERLRAVLTEITAAAQSFREAHLVRREVDILDSHGRLGADWCDRVIAAENNELLTLSALCRLAGQFFTPCT